MGVPFMCSAKVDNAISFLGLVEHKRNSGDPCAIL